MAYSPLALPNIMESIGATTTTVRSSFFSFQFLYFLLTVEFLARGFIVNDDMLQTVPYRSPQGGGAEGSELFWPICLHDQ